MTDEMRLSKVEDKVNQVYAKITNGLSEKTNHNYEKINSIETELREHKECSQIHRTNITKSINDLKSTFQAYMTIEEKTHEVQEQQMTLLSEAVVKAVDKMETWDEKLRKVLIWGICGLGGLIITLTAYALSNPDKIIEVLKTLT